MTIHASTTQMVTTPDNHLLVGPPLAVIRQKNSGMISLIESVEAIAFIDGCPSDRRACYAQISYEKDDCSTSWRF